MRLSAHETAHFTILSRTWWKVWTHWDDYRARTIPCDQDQANCRGCQNHLPLRFKAYLHVIHHEARKAVFLELTPNAAKQLEGQAPPNEPFRGLEISLARGHGPKAGLRLTVNQYHPRETNLPPEQDPKPILTALWEMPDRRRRFRGEVA